MPQGQAPPRAEPAFLWIGRGPRPRGEERSAGGHLGSGFWPKWGAFACPGPAPPPPRRSEPRINSTRPQRPGSGADLLLSEPRCSGPLVCRAGVARTLGQAGRRAAGGSSGRGLTVVFCSRDICPGRGPGSSTVEGAECEGAGRGGIPRGSAGAPPHLPTLRGSCGWVPCPLRCLPGKQRVTLGVCARRGHPVRPEGPAWLVLTEALCSLTAGTPPHPLAPHVGWGSAAHERGPASLWHRFPRQSPCRLPLPLPSCPGSRQRPVPTLPPLPHPGFSCSPGERLPPPLRPHLVLLS